ncbi:MAG: endonuclease/exonuclease/phosphatase family protein, partial [Chloroflexota bacterium]
ILSKYPLIEAKPFELMPRRMSMHAVLDVEGQPLHVIVLHLTPNQLGDLEGQSLPARLRERFTIRSNEITELIIELQKIDAPVLVLCDCNFAETSQAYQRLHEHLNEVHRAIGWGFGKSNGDPLAYQRVDYIWFSDSLAPQSVRFEDAAASDHKPIFATFQFE